MDARNYWTHVCSANQIQENISFMTTSKYHTREKYESLLKMICTQTNKPVPKRISGMSNWELMTVINTKLVDNGCVPLNDIELKPHKL